MLQGLARSLRFTRCSTAILILIVPSILYAKSPCTDMLSYGVYNELKSTGAYRSFKDFRSKFCSDYRRAKEEGRKIDTEYMGYGYGKGSFGESEMDHLSSHVCNESSSMEDESASHDSFAKIVSSEFMDGYKACLKANTDQVTIQATYPESDDSADPLIVNVRARSGLTDGFLDVRIQSVVGFTKCEGTLAKSIKAKKAVRLKNNGRGILTCHRESYTPAKDNVTSPAASLVVDATDEPLKIWLPAVQKQADIARVPLRRIVRRAADYNVGTPGVSPKGIGNLSYDGTLTDGASGPKQALYSISVQPLELIACLSNTLPRSGAR